MDNHSESNGLGHPQSALPLIGYGRGRNLEPQLGQRTSSLSTNSPVGISEQNRPVVPEAEAVEAGTSSASDVRYSGGDVRYSGGDVRYSGGDVRYSGGDVRYSGGDIRYSGGDVRYSGSDVRISRGSLSGAGFGRGAIAASGVGGASGVVNRVNNTVSRVGGGTRGFGLGGNVDGAGGSTRGIDFGSLTRAGIGRGERVAGAVVNRVDNVVSSAGGGTRASLSGAGFGRGTRVSGGDGAAGGVVSRVGDAGGGSSLASLSRAGFRRGASVPSGDGGADASGVDHCINNAGTGSDKKRPVFPLYDVVHTRPQDMVTKTGVSGTKVILQTNYFRVLSKPDWTIHQYRVDFSPEVDNTRQRCGYLADHKDLLGGYVFDGTVLFCTKKFVAPGPDANVLHLTSVGRSREKIKIRIRYTTRVETADCQQFQVLNLILRRAMAGLNMQLISRNFFDPEAMIPMREYKIEIWPGYLTSIRQHERDILMCSDAVHKIMRTETLYSIMTLCKLGNGDVQKTFRNTVVGTIVLTDYNNKTYRVDDVDFQISPRSTFPTKDGDISYVDYYKRRYNLTIHDLNQPLLVSRPTEKNIRGGKKQLIMLVPEFARATGMSKEMRANFNLMKALSGYTRLSPERRLERLRIFNDHLQTSKASTDVLNLWNLKLDTKLVEVQARVLPPQRIVFGNERRYNCDEHADWTFQFRNNSMFKQIDIKRWIIIAPERSMREVQQFANMCVEAAKGMQMHISQPKYEEISNERNTTFSDAIDRSVAKDPQMIMIVLLTPNEEKYNCIKKRTCVDRPLPSQVVTLKTITPRKDRTAGLMSIATKVVIQMNAKLKGIPWMIELPLSGLMTVGFDVCHSSKIKNKSYGALVATTDLKQSTGSFFSSVSEHLKGQELSHQMTMHMINALNAYTEKHQGLPERILFFRDGVGDGQLSQVVETEVEVLKKSLDEIYHSKGHKGGCRMAYIVVAKRIHTRFFLNKCNPMPGTVVDDVVTLPERYDFFLVSQSVRQGTVTPSSYNVIHDTMELGADKLQLLSFKISHLYYNFSGTCRVPAVCQYAHKLAFLTAENINRAPSALLAYQLYFL